MNYRIISKMLIISFAVILIVYDFFPVMSGVKGDTISEVILVWGLHSFSVPFAFGMLCGHFFLPMDGLPTPKPYILCPIGAVVILLDVAANVFHLSFLFWLQSYPIFAFSVGFVIGTLLWPQTRRERLKGDHHA